MRYTRAGREEEAACDEVLVAVGRAPRVEGIGLEAAGVRFGPRGVEVDARLRTHSSRIYAVGDVCSRWKLTHAADAQARLVVRNALFFGRGRADRLLIPRVVYTSPEVAAVGLCGEEARARGEVETLTVPLEEVDRARLEGEEGGFLRLHLERGTDRILGATLVGECAGEIVPLVAHAISAGVGLERLGELVFPYPTRAEVLRRAADRVRRRRLTPRARRVLGVLLRLLR